MTPEDWRTLIILIISAAGLFLCGAAWGYALCRWGSDRKFRRWLGDYPSPRQGIQIEKQAKEITPQPATKPKALYAHGGIVPGRKTHPPQ